MPKSSENRFDKPTVATLAKRAGYICSNPYCKAYTSGPHSEDGKAVIIGEAAHIRGAEPGSARYEPSMTPTERRNITNGIWLCRKCARLIDADEKRYKVELLYHWKRVHEEEMEIELNTNGWQRKISAYNLRAFENESPAAQQLALDHPEYWEYLLTMELLRSKLKPIKRDFDYLERGLMYRPSRIFDGQFFFTWLRQKLQDLPAIIHLLLLASTEILMASWGEAGAAGDALEIKAAVEKICFGCQSLLEWEVDLHFTEFPDDFDEIKKKMAGWTHHFLAEMDRLPKEIAKIFDEPQPEGLYRINLVFNPPENVEEVRNEITQIMDRGKTSRQADKGVNVLQTTKESL